jgi:hypothetical protein
MASAIFYPFLFPAKPWFETRRVAPLLTMRLATDLILRSAPQGASRRILSKHVMPALVAGIHV